MNLVLEDRSKIEDIAKETKGAQSLNVTEVTQDRPVTVLLVGERPVGSAPVLTLAEALKPYGVRPVFSENVESASTADWLRLLRRSDVVLYVGYSGPGPYTIRQLALAGCIGKPIVRWWVGSDVLYCTEDRVNARRAKVLDRLCSEAVTGAPHLQRELASIGIDAKLIPTVVDPAFLENDSPRGEIGRDILVY